MAACLQGAATAPTVRGGAAAAAAAVPGVSKDEAITAQIYEARAPRSESIVTIVLGILSPPCGVAPRGLEIPNQTFSKY